MSTIAYAQLTNAREAATPNTSTSSESPGLRTYIDAVAALIPAEVLTLHALIMAATTETLAGTGGVRIHAGDESTVRGAFWALMAMSVLLYVIPRYFGGKWDRFDWIRVAIAPLAFVAWTMLQRATAFDAFAAGSPGRRTVIALFLGAILSAVSAGLALKADAKPAT